MRNRAAWCHAETLPGNHSRLRKSDQEKEWAMTISKHITTGIAATFASGMILLTVASGALALTPASRDVSDQRLPTAHTSAGTVIKKRDAATTATQPTTPPTTNGASAIVRDHRTPEDSPPKTTPKGPAKPTVAYGDPQDRDHRPGGNADPCLQPNNTCSASARNASIVAFRQKRPDLIGLDVDPCFQAKSCNKTQLTETLIARAQKNLDVGFCDSRIKGQGCAQINVLPDGTRLTLHYDHNKGHLLEADREHLIAVLEASLKKSLGGGSIQTPTPSTAHKQN